MSVAFVLTVYNKAAFLPRVLDALAAERSDVDGSIILVDDGSTDDSADLLQAFAQAQPRTRLIRQLNTGVAGATNAGVSAAYGDYLRLVDGDDILTLGSTRALLEVLIQERCALCFGQLVRGTGVFPVSPGPPPRRIERPLRAMLRNTPLNPSVALTRMEFAKAATPLPTFARTAQDFSFCIRVARFGPFCAIPQVCAVAPPRAAGRLSTSELRQNRDLALLAATLCHEWPADEQRYGVARFARRAARFLSRHAPGQWADRMRMRALATAAAAGLPLRFQSAYAGIAALYTRISHGWAKPSLPR